MKMESLFAIGDVVYVKNGLARSVTRGIVDGIELAVWATDYRGSATQHMIKYRLVVTDRPDRGFVHTKAPECECYDSWDAAWGEIR